MREIPTVEEILDANATQPEVVAIREYWVPTPEQVTALAALEIAGARTAMETTIFMAWRRAMFEENAKRKALSEVAKTRIDQEVKDLKERSDTITKIMGAVLEKYPPPLMEIEEAEATVSGCEARENGDWLFIFKAARETHLNQGTMEDLVLVYQRQEQEKEFLAKMKHVSGDFNRWITRFQDQMETCKTVGVPLSDEAKIHYSADNLNATIFGEIKATFMILSTRALFPRTYEGFKQRIFAEYSQISTRKPQAVFKVIRSEECKRYDEVNFKAEEKSDKMDRGCHICGRNGHF